ncbi:MAG: hypothetical protein V4538_16310 [Bacteroidota bacterium]
MKIIITTDILDPSIQQPFTGKSLDFLQDANKEIHLGLAISLIGNSYDISKAYILNGIVPYGTNQYTAGFILWNEEIYYCPGKTTTTAFANVAIFTITITNDSIADPLVFSDNISRNVHKVRRLILSDGVSGSGTFDLLDAIYINTDWIANDSSTSYRREGGTVFLSGPAGNVGTSMGNGATSFTLPIGFRPTTTKTVRGVLFFDEQLVKGAGILTINTNGTIYHSSLTGAGTARWVSLTGASFDL